MGSGPPPDSPSSSSSSGSSSSGGEDKPACRMCGSTKHHEKDCPKLTANKRGKKGDPPGSSPDGGGSSSSHGSNAGSHRDAAIGSATAEKTFALPFRPRLKMRHKPEDTSTRSSWR